MFHKSIIKLKIDYLILTYLIYSFYAIYLSSYKYTIPLILLTGIILINKFPISNLCDNTKKLILLFIFPFGLYFIMQSPTGFGPLNINYESSYLFTFYFIIKFLFIFFLIKFNKKFFFETILLFLLLFYIDYYLIKFLNFGFSKTTVEWKSIYESIIFFILYVIIFRKNNFSTLITFYISLHLANYAAAGLAKLDVAGLKWVYNETHILIDHHLYRGWIENNVITDILRKIINPNTNFYLNILFLSFQLFSIIVFFNRYFLILFLVLADITHILIGLSAGVWFYKWIIINTVLIFYNNEFFEIVSNIKLRSKLFLSISIILLSQLNTFYPLGWLDGRIGTKYNFYGYLDNGTTVELKPTFFSSANFEIAYEIRKIINETPPVYLSGYKDKKEKDKVMKCNYDTKKNNSKSINEDKRKIESLILQSIENKNLIFILLKNIQPYHLFYPSFKKEKINFQRKELLENLNKIVITSSMFCENDKREVFELKNLLFYEIKIK